MPAPGPVSRNKASIIADYGAGVGAGELARRYEVTDQSISVMLSRAGVRLTTAERGARIREGQLRANAYRRATYG